MALPVVDEQHVKGALFKASGGGTLFAATGAYPAVVDMCFVRTLAQNHHWLD